jgi:phosphonate transport system substrate-binding protein
MDEKIMNTQSLKRYQAALLFTLVFFSSVASAYELAIMPVRSKALTEKLYQPLADYLSKATGKPIHLKTYNNFVNYWQDMRDGKLDIVLDAAHFVDYRAKQKEHQVLVKLKDKVSFSLVSSEDLAILEPAELIGKPIACLPPPSRGNLEIDSFFKNPIRQPRKVEVKSYEEAVMLLEQGKVQAAVIPTPMLNAFPNLMVIDSTDLWPHMAMTASANVPTEVKSAIAKALLGMEKDMQGNEALANSGLTGFEPADHSLYDGYSKALSTYGNYNY